ncbi:MAG: TolC family protein [Flavobacteriales bacterium]|nr:TolC family protein [Flavobacteriales bacterium]MBK6944430.1 TolC family protein [Flavobacteriales bacterium]MBK9534099.1 TolC family protein [Flavobacteriales bacterium]MBP9137433.1 TolC family protein [Flavobacteriales bacterium]HQV51938.1 TolC family protein [Flavobacteriales bacterium]
MIHRVWLTLGLVALTSIGAKAQGPLSLSLQQALDLAAKQSYAVQASALEAEKSIHRSKEIAAVGLPQINGSVQLQNFIDVPTQLIPNFFSPPGSGAPELLPVQFGVPWSMNAGLSLNQLIFDGSYLVGLKAAMELRVQSQQELEKAQADARNQTAKAYFGVLAAEEGIRLIGESLPLLEKSLNEVTATFEAGFLEQTDVDRINIQLEQARAQQRNFEQQANVARMLLALTMGTPQGTPLILTDELENILKDPNETSLSEQELVASSHIELQAANTIVGLSVLEHKNDVVKALPSLGGFLQHSQVWNGPTFDPGGQYQFYPTTLWGLQLNVPIFSSGSRIQKAKQTKIAIEQAKVNQTATEQRLIAMAEQSRSQARTAMDNLLTEEKSMELSKKIMDRTTIKFNTGSASSFEYTQEQGNYLMAQQMYIQRMVELLMARADLRKSLDLY